MVDTHGSDNFLENNVDDEAGMGVEESISLDISVKVKIVAEVNENNDDDEVEEILILV